MGMETVDSAEDLDFTEFALSGMTNFFLNEQTVTLKSHYIPWETFLKVNNAKMFMLSFY